MRAFWRLVSLFRESDHETTKIQDGEPTEEPIRRDKEGRRRVDYTHTCCDCGLRHSIVIEIKRRKLVFFYWRKQ